MTLLRIAGTILLVAIKPLSAGFFLLDTLTGVTDVLDGRIARETKAAGDFGARLDCIADLLFLAVMLFRICPLRRLEYADSCFHRSPIIQLGIADP